MKSSCCPHWGAAAHPPGHAKQSASLQAALPRAPRHWEWCVVQHMAIKYVVFIRHLQMAFADGIYRWHSIAFILFFLLDCIWIEPWNPGDINQWMMETCCFFFQQSQGFKGNMDKMYSRQFDVWVCLKSAGQNDELIFIWEWNRGPWFLDTPVLLVFFVGSTSAKARTRPGMFDGAESMVEILKFKQIYGHWWTNWTGYESMGLYINHKWRYKMLQVLLTGFSGHNCRVYSRPYSWIRGWSHIGPWW